VEWCEGPFWVIDTAYIASVDPDVDLKWFYYIVKYVGLNHLKSGEKPGLQRDAFRAQLFPFPDKDVQSEIALVLSAIDDRISSNRHLSVALEALSSALFDSWFVDFDPVVAKRDGKRPIGVPADTIDLFPSHFEESKLGPIPKGWAAVPVGERFDVAMGQSPPGSTYNERGDGLPFYQGRTDFGFRYPSRRMYCTAPTRFAKPGDTLISVRAPVGDANMAIEPCAIGRGVAAVRHKDNKPSFTYYAMLSLREEFDVYEGEGTLFGAIGGEDLRRVPFVHPSDPILEAFEELVGPMDALIESNERESVRLAELRDSLVGPLLSGELTIKTAEKTVGAAL
jgi:type I restriction enzyme S subunit